ncbi:MAG: DegT/DnrJ/EryC1/StrS family aminotransferase [Candidatus Krumholzibacteria bacterium]|nr:DegT/DnrJ/EryC1/StrS family aminotransferase [Candidatus Krumholzibacteria bacterium]
MTVKLLDLVPQYESIRDEIREAIDGVLSTQQFILGKKVEALEEEIARYCGSRFAVGVASGTDAILLSLMAIGAGHGDEVITTPYTFFSTVSSITRLGATPVFADIDPRTYNIDPGMVAARITPRTRAIIAVHLFGQPADMGPIMDAAGRRDIPVIEDACQSIGALYKGKRAGSIGSIGCLSFFPSKNLGGYGDGGMVVTDNEGLADKVRMMRVHGGRERYYHDVVGINSRLDSIQAAILLVKMRHLEKWHEGRRANAAFYDRELARISGVTIPFVESHNVSVYNQYVIRVQERDALRAFLQENGVGCEVYYPVPLHLQKCFAFLGGKTGDNSESEAAARETLAIPVFPELTIAQRDYVVSSIRAFQERRA